MFFNKKSNNNVNCKSCKSSVNKKYDFCPHCGSSLNPEKEAKDFGMLGRNDLNENQVPTREEQNVAANLGFTDKIIGSLVNNLMRSLDKQFKELEKQEGSLPEIKQFPNGIKIRIGPPVQKKAAPKVQRRAITDEQIQKMSSMPRAVAKTNVRRLSDKIIYELSAPGIASPNDVFISKLENGYEIKAIGKKKIFVNSLPLELPIRGYSISDDKLSVEFKLVDENQFI